MNRLEYLTQLRRLLEDGGLAEDEINDAMGFYEEIFLDAGQPMKLKLPQTSARPKSLPTKFCRIVAYTHRATRYFKWKPPLTPHRLVILTIMCHITAILSQSFLLSSSQAQYGSALCVPLPQ